MPATNAELIGAALTDIANAIRAKNGSSDTYTMAEMATTIANLPSGGSGFRYDMGSFFGDHQGSFATSLECSGSCVVGEKILLIVMHRDTITLSDNGFSRLYSIPNSNQGPNIISVYEKTASSSTFSVTITQSSEARMCACYFIIGSGVTVGSPTTQYMDTDSSTYRYTIAASESPYLCVMSNGYASSSPAAQSITPIRAILPHSQWLNSSSYATGRMAAFVSSGDFVNTVMDIAAIAYTEDRNSNELYIFPLTSIS